MSQIEIMITWLKVKFLRTTATANGRTADVCKTPENNFII